MQINIHDLLDSYESEESFLQCDNNIDCSRISEKVRKVINKKRGLSVRKSKKLVVLVAAVVLLLAASITVAAATDGEIFNKVHVFFTGANGEMTSKTATLKSVQGEGDSKQYIFSFDDEDYTDSSESADSLTVK